MLNKIRCYLTRNMDFAVSLAIYDIHENILKNHEEKYTTLLYFVIFLKRLIQLTTAYSYTNLNTFMELEAYPKNC